MRLLPIVLLAAGGLVACGGSVSGTSTSSTSSDGTGGAGGASGTSSTSTSGSTTSSTSTTATATGGGGGGSGAGDGVAIPADSLPSQVNTSTWLTAGETLAPSTLLLVFDTIVGTCASFHLAAGTTNQALVVIGLPTALQAPGTYMFSSTDVIAWGSFWLGDGMGNGGGGSMPLTTGSITVTSIDLGSVQVTLSGLPSDYTALEGAHTAVRCP